MSNKEFVRVIDIPYLIEIVAERFDNALELIGQHSLLYGGAVRDIIAGLPIEGDLDVAVNNFAYAQVLANFFSSPKWIKVGRDGKAEIPKLKPLSIKKGGRPEAVINKYANIPTTSYSNNPYKDITSIMQTVSFETFDNARVQLVQAVPGTDERKDPLQSPLSLARGADIRCCSLAVNYLGKVFELVDGAYVDCKDRVLVINKIEDPNRFNNLEARIKKLEERGWKSKINLDKVKIQLKKARAKKTKAQPNKKDGMINAGRIVSKYFITEANGTNYIFQIDRRIRDVVGGDIIRLADEYRHQNSDRMDRIPPRRDGYVAYKTGSAKCINGFANFLADKARRHHGIVKKAPVIPAKLPINPTRRTKKQAKKARSLREAAAEFGMPKWEDEPVKVKGGIIIPEGAPELTRNIELSQNTWRRSGISSSQKKVTRDYTKGTAEYMSEYDNAMRNVKTHATDRAVTKAKPATEEGMPNASRYFATYRFGNQEEGETERLEPEEVEKINEAVDRLHKKLKETSPKRKRLEKVWNKKKGR